MKIKMIFRKNSNKKEAHFSSKETKPSNMAFNANLKSKVSSIKNITLLKKKIYLALSVLLVVFLLGGCFFVFKTGYILNKISESNNSTLESVFGILPVIGSRQDVKQDKQGRTNILLIGMRGENMPGGGLLADTIILVTLKLDPVEGGNDDRVGLVSIPRDLYVKMPNTTQHSKINAVYYYGEEKLNTTGLSDMKAIVSEVTGLEIHYSAALNFNGFKQLVDTVGGVTVNLETPFYEVSQFVLGNECGGEFILPAGVNVLDGETALCYIRARENTSDFDRAKRQQLVLKELKDQLISLDTFSDFSKLNGILNAVGDNVKTDMTSNDMRKFFEKYIGIQDAIIYQRVLENSPEGLLIVPQDVPEEVGYILTPRAGQDNYTAIHNVVQNIFNLPSQSDIEPVKQYFKPQLPVEEDSKDEKDEKKDDKENEDK